MLRQEPHSQDPNSQEHSAGQVRVKKDEFARAIAALEARRQAQAQELEGTVVIGDVLQQLQISLPADEVLQEIEAIHAGQPREQAPRRPLWTAEQAATARLASGIAIVPIAAVAIATLMLTAPKQNSLPHPPGATGTGIAGVRMAGMGRDLPLFLPPPPSNPASASGEVMDEGGFNASSVLKPLAQVPDNQPVHCTTASLQKLFSMGYPTPVLLDPITLAQSSQPFDVRPNLHKPWTLIKHDGKLYLRGWVTTKFTELQAQGKMVTLHSTPSSFEPGVRPALITLLVKFRPYFSGNMGFEGQPALLQVEGAPSTPPTWQNLQRVGISPSRIILDSHAWEKWQP